MPISKYKYTKSLSQSATTKNNYKDRRFPWKYHITSKMEYIKLKLKGQNWLIESKARLSLETITRYGRSKSNFGYVPTNLT